LVLNAVDLMPCSLELLVIQLRGSGAGQPPLRAAHNRHHHLQIAQQLGASPGQSFFLCLSLRFEKQLGIIQNAFADRGRTFAPPLIVPFLLARRRLPESLLGFPN